MASRAPALLAVIAVAVPARAGDLIPVPEFSDHEVPISMPPLPDNPGWEWLNVGLLLGALILATYFALVNRSRRGMFVLGIASAAGVARYARG
ncbi:MAG: hypothetical protein JJ992_06820, partial [Planctomycetes bacterium]|nr:hypothetical protein [Planctomycetota bacterium]